MEIDQLVHALEKAYQETQSWRLVGEQFGLSAGMAHSIARRGYEPRSPRVRRLLELGPLPLTARVVVVAGDLPNGTQVLGEWRACPRCGARFSPNHPRRKYCLTCSPPRGRKEDRDNG